MKYEVNTLFTTMKYLTPHTSYLTFYISHLKKMNQNNKNENQITIDIPENIVDGVYSNVALVTHTGSEFVLDFIHLLPNTVKAKVRARILVAPEHTKRLMLALKENIAHYETQFGEIKFPEDKNPPFGR